MASTILVWIVFILIVGAVFVTQHENIERWIDTFPHRKVDVPPRQTLDEVGRTLEEESNLYYDHAQIARIREAHRRLHNQWLFVAGNVWTVDERKQLGLPKVWDQDDTLVQVEDDDDDEYTIRSWQGAIKVTHKGGLTHRGDETCYECAKTKWGRSGPPPTSPKLRKRQ